MTHPLKVFLCHAHSDKDTVKALYARLKREGVDVWLDKEKLLPGADWEFEIRKAVRESDVVIVCLSKQFNQAGFRQKEVRIALEEADNKPPGEIFIIPARLEECDNLPTLTKWHWVDLFENDGFQRLILALRLRAEKIGASLRQRGATQSRQKKDAEQREAEETAKREAAEKAERERLARAAEENTKRENAEREAAEKAERERLARDAAENTKRENAKRDAAKKAERERAEREKAKRELAPKFKPLGWAGVAGIAFVCLLLAFLGGNYLLKNLPSSTTEAPRTMTAAPSKTKTPATFGIGWIMTSEKDGMVLVYVPAGEFTMGSDADDALAECQKYRSDCEREWFINEEPPHKVELDAYWIDQTEVTNAMYAKCVNDGSCEPPTSSESYSHELYFGNPTYNDYPIIHINWYHAAAYCKWAGRELPTEAQWEKAARGPNGRTYSWGESISCSFTNYWGKDEGCIGDTSRVGSYPDGASIYGALDMTGNVWEWVKDWYLSTYYEEFPVSNPLGPSSGQERTVRGGGWSNREYRSRTTRREFLSPTTDGDGLGFRCALSQP